MNENETRKNDDHTEVHEEPRTMSDDEVHDYNGLTLNEQGEEEKKEEPDDGFTIHIHSFDIHHIPWWKKALIAVGAVACFGIFILLAIATAWIVLVGGAIVLGAALILYLVRKYIL